MLCMHFPNPLRPGIYLLKVHGSLDTFTFNDGKDVLRLLPQALGPAGIFDALRAGPRTATCSTSIRAQSAG
jgi:hypothetical protein